MTKDEKEHRSFVLRHSSASASISCQYMNLFQAVLGRHLIHDLGLPMCLFAYGPYGQETGAPAWPKLPFMMAKSRIPVTPSLLKSARRSVMLLNVARRTWKSRTPTTLSLSASPPPCAPIST